jgi:hypothetical protein
MKGNFLRVGTQQLANFLSDLEQFGLYVSRPPTIAADSAILLSKNRNNLTFFFLICLFVYACNVQLLRCICEKSRPNEII